LHAIDRVAKRRAADPGPLHERSRTPRRSRFSDAALHAASRPGHEAAQLAANFISLMASKSCTPPPTRLVV
jgi:hypothetical protein